MKRSWLALWMCLTTSTALAQSTPTQCNPTDRADKYRFLRQLSLDLRGRIPTVEEYEALQNAEDVSAEQIEQMFSSEDFGWAMRAYHMRHVFPNIAPDALWPNTRRLTSRGARGLWWAPGAARLFRGAPGVSCADEPHTEFDGAGHALPLRLQAVDGAACPAQGCRIDGYVQVQPYWAPDVTLRVCAFDAQTATEGQNGPCDGPNAAADSGCGCGDALNSCVALGDQGSAVELIAGLAGEPLSIFEQVVRDDRPYFEALTTRETRVNGPAVHYYRHMHAQMQGGFPRQNPLDGRMGDLPDIPFDEQQPVSLMRDEEHSGVLTTLEYLLRFNSDRGRANQLYTQLLCQPFIAPSGGLPPATDDCSQEPDLTERCGCNSCHASLEPAAAHWGRWEHTQRFGYLSPDVYPDRDQSCGDCSDRGPNRCSGDCFLYYNTPFGGEQTPGLLQSLEYRSDEEAAALLSGPAGLVQSKLDDGSLPICTVTRLAEHLLKRPLSGDERAEVIPDLVTYFGANQHSFKRLLSALIENPGYRALQ